MNRSPVLIVGAGPTGLALALALVKCGITPRIIDMKPGVVRESRAVGVQARTLEFYRQLGIADQVVSAGTQVGKIFMRRRGRAVTEIDVANFGSGLSTFPFILCLPQDEHERLLASHLAGLGVHVEWNRKLLTLQDTGTEVKARLAGKDGDEECIAHYVVGCDGGRSRVREELQLGFPGATSQKTYFVADVEATGDATDPVQAAGSFSFCLDAADFMLVLPARGSGSYRLIGLLPDGSTGGTTEFDDIRRTVEKTTGVHVDKVNWFSTYRVHHRVADHFGVGRVFVAGDAGHVHSPLGGQGMNTGIGDAVNLSWKLAAVLQHRADTSILDTYEAERIPFARLLVATTDKLFQRISGAGMGRRIARRILFLHVIPRLLHYGRTRRLVFRRISQAHVNYRGSRLSEGSTGDIEAGDRLPWVALDAARDNYLPLRSFEWQIHVYGYAEKAMREAARAAGVPLHEFAWSAAMETARFAQNACYLIRPDGYIAVAGAGQDVQILAKLLSRFQVRAQNAP